MADFTEVVTQGWGSRIMDSIKGVLFGVVLFLVSFVLLWWNEGRAIKTERGLDEGASQVVTVDHSKIDESNNSKLVHLTGPVETQGILKDYEFGIEINAIKLRRNVEMYQWKENEETSSSKKVGGSKESTTTYTYVKTWDSFLIDSDEFKVPEEHTNPKGFPYSFYTKQVDDATIGAFTLPGSLISDISNFSAYPITEVDTLKVKNARVVNSLVYIGEGKNVDPKIGDTKVSFKVIEKGVYSIVAKQIDDTFEYFNTSEGTTIEMISPGVVSAENMFKEAQQQNMILTWALRVGGFFLMFFGLTLIFRPLVILADVLPFLGSMLGMGLGLATGLISLVLSFITIAIAWFTYRPVLAVSLLAAGIVIFVLFYMKSKSKKKIKAETTAAVESEGTTTAEPEGTTAAEPEGTTEAESDDTAESSRPDG